MNASTLSSNPAQGRAAVVLPDGILTNSSLQGVRHWMLEHFQLLAVVSLPQFAFQHYDAGVKASIVFLRRLGDGETVPDDEPIFMALADNIGYDGAGRSTFVVTVEEESPPVARKSSYIAVTCSTSASSTSGPTLGSGETGWSERRREVIPNTGLVAQWKAFQMASDTFSSIRPAEIAGVKAYALTRDSIEPRLRYSVQPSPLQATEPSFGRNDSADTRTG